MNRRIRKALDYCAKQRGVTFADARIVRQDAREHWMVSGVARWSETEDFTGLGVRVLCNGSWGYSGGDVSGPSVVARQAVENARSAARYNKDPESYPERTPQVGSWHQNIIEDPFDIPRGEILDSLAKIDQHLIHPNATHRYAEFSFFKTRKEYGNTEGTDVEQEFRHVIGDLALMNTQEGLRRTYDAGFLTAQGGFERIREWKFPENAERINREFSLMRNARKCPSGRMTIILHPSQLLMQTHETVHGLELDRILGSETEFMGQNQFPVRKIGEYQFGSPLVNIRADATYENAVGSFGWDDEGVPAQNAYLVRNGVLVNVLNSRQSLSQANLSLQNTSSFRAENDSYLPLVRMTNCFIEPGSKSISDIIAETERGILLESCRSWSLDNWRRNFHFGTEIGWLIEDGQITRLVANPNYTGDSQRFWHSCDAISKEHMLLGVSNCGKGVPGQSIYCGHPSPYARFQNTLVSQGSGGAQTSRCQRRRRR